MTGRSFMAYLNHCRIERAQTLLASTDKSVSDISQEMGFCDQSYFGTVFRRLVGMTPAAYRRQMQTGGHERRLIGNRGHTGLDRQTADPR